MRDVICKKVNEYCKDKSGMGMEIEKQGRGRSRCHVQMCHVELFGVIN